MKRTFSLILSLALCVVIVLGTLVSSGVTVSLAKSSATYTLELWLLCDHEYALSRGEKSLISENGAAPYAYETGTVYVPLAAACKYKNASYALADDGTVTVTKSDGATAAMTVGSTTWSGGEFLLPVVEKNGDVYISILSVNDLFATKSLYNKDIGLVVFYELGYTSSGGSLQSQLETLGNLLFERPTASTVYADLLSNVGSADEHPRLLATSDDFDRLRAVLDNPDFDSDSLYSKMNNLVVASLASFNAYFTVDPETGEVSWKSEKVQKSLRQPYYIYDENGNRLVGVKTYTYVDENGDEITLTPGGSELGDGYDYGGRSNVNKLTVKLKEFAFLWQMFGEQKYADAFYLLALELGKWEHWGEGHFLNCADGSVEFAIGLDWIYHAFDDEPEKRDEMAKILYEKGMMKGYYSIVCDSLYRNGTPKIDLVSGSYNNAKQYGSHTALGSSAASNYLHISAKAGNTAWRTINRTNNWQTVCGSGMIVAALYLSEYEEYRDNSTFVIEQYLLSLERCLPQYAPDGAYIESPGYWGYGTNTLMVTLSALETSLGKTYGYDDIIGLYDSFYYTIGIADGEYRMWNYHDSGIGSVDYQYFYYAARLFDDPTLAYLRDGMVFGGGKTFTLMDAIFYSEELSEGASFESMPLDYNFKGIDTATFRSAYGTGEIYTGLHTGPNNVTHGDFDCGNFTLTMGGVKWVTDPAPEDYNVNGFWDSGEYGKRYHLYAKSIEGHSTVMIRNESSLPLGQKYTTYSTDYATIDKFYSDSLGGYAITDMTTEYGSRCVSGKRGVLLTNSRSTVVLQDEISFSRETDLAWVLNLQNYIFISDDGRSITAKANYNGEEVTMRVSLISEDTSLKFRIMNVGNYETGVKYETVFPDTYTKTNNQDPRASDPVQRIIIEANDVTSFNVAVVFQILGHKNEIVPYRYTAMDSWATESDEWVKEANKGLDYGGDDKPVVPQTTYKLFLRANERLAAAYEQDDLLLVGQILRETSDYLLNYDDKNSSVVAVAAEYRAYRRTYNLLIRGANAAFSDLIFGTEKG